MDAKSMQLLLQKNKSGANVHRCTFDSSCALFVPAGYCIAERCQQDLTGMRLGLLTLTPHMKSCLQDMSLSKEMAKQDKSVTDTMSSMVRHVWI
eukprot:4688583-Amphidinium_carterae.2